MRNAQDCRKAPSTRGWVVVCGCDWEAWTELLTSSHNMLWALALVGLVVCPTPGASHGFLSYPKSRNWQARIDGQEYCPHCKAAGGPSMNKMRLKEATGEERWPYPESVESSARHGAPPSLPPAPAPSIPAHASPRWHAPNAVGTREEACLPQKHLACRPACAPQHVHACPHACVRAGLCGDAAGGTEAYIANRPVLHTFQTGSTVTLEVVVTTHHRGHFEFSLCDMGTVQGDRVTQSCLNQHRLQRAPGSAGTSPIDAAYPGRYYLEPSCATADTAGKYPGTVDGSTPDYVERWHASAQKMRADYVLPPGLVCDHCVLQWWWVTANSCIPKGHKEFFASGKAPTKYAACSGDGPGQGWAGMALEDCNVHSWPEEFWNCADVAVTADGKGGQDAEATQLPPPPATAAAATRDAGGSPTPAPSPSPPTTKPSPSTPQGNGSQVGTFRTSMDTWTGGCTLEVVLTVPATVTSWAVELRFGQSPAALYAWDTTASGSGPTRRFSTKPYNAAQTRGSELKLHMSLTVTGSAGVDVVSATFVGMVGPNGEDIADGQDRPTPPLCPDKMWHKLIFTCTPGNTRCRRTVKA